MDACGRFPPHASFALPKLDSFEIAPFRVGADYLDEHISFRVRPGKEDGRTAEGLGAHDAMSEVKYLIEVRPRIVRSKRFRSE
jgi:hypothetical protein